MRRKAAIVIILAALTATLSFLTEKPSSPAAQVKQFYIRQGKELEKEIILLQKLAASGNTKKMQEQFLKTRRAYKQAETIVEYYFSFFAVKLNGPAIPFFEEDEPDIGRQEPAGMQLIESILFPQYPPGEKKKLQNALGNLLQDTRTMLETTESNAFNDEFIFDAVTEELFRITALGITGFDSPSAGNSLPECAAALEGLQKILLLYRQDIKQADAPAEQQLYGMLPKAVNYLRQNREFNSFNRMEFILQYLNPLAKIIGAYKTKKGYAENRSPMFYSTIRKNNNLFAAGIFNANKYLDDNTTSPARIEMGKLLFFDNRLSRDNNRSCATCHNPSKAFTDGLSTSIAVDGHTALPRNAPTLINVALQRNLFLDNRSFSLEDQVMQVLNNAKEMHGSAQEAAEKILRQPKYDTLYAQAYPGANPAAAAQNICNAIACYERTLIALDSKFDRHMRGIPSLDAQEINGFNLFMGKAKCGTCHFMPLFSGAKPPRYYYNETEVIGVPDKNTRNHPRLDNDEGRFLITGLPLHKYSFKTTTLRNIALTGPYMHNGVFKTLDEVIDFYNNGGGRGLNIAPANQTLPFEKLNLSQTEKRHLIAFLHTLTDTIPQKKIY